jgi:hypothetical protein
MTISITITITMTIALTTIHTPEPVLYSLYPVFSQFSPSSHSPTQSTPTQLTIFIFEL